MLRKILSVILIFSMIFTSLPFVSATEEASVAKETSTIKEKATNQVKEFDDVQQGDWYYDAVQYGVQRGLFQGLGTGFSPLTGMTRAMFIMVLARMAEVDLEEYSRQSRYFDAKPEDWYTAALTWATEKGIAFGDFQGNFNPNVLVTREQMAVFTVRFMEALSIPFPEAEVDSIPADLDSVSDYAKDAVLKLWSVGLLKGDEGGNLSPQEPATRAEAAVFSFRADEVVDAWLVETGQKAQNPAEEPKDPSQDEEPETKPEPQPEPEPEPQPSESTRYTLRYLDGIRIIAQFVVEEGTTPNPVPSVEQIAKEDAVFVGWYLDEVCTQPFFATTVLNKPTNVYAKYDALVRALSTPMSYTLLDQSPTIHFDLVQKGNTPVEQSVLLEIMDGSDPVELSFTDLGEGSLRVAAKNGFTAGSSYQLTLHEGWDFEGKDTSLRTVSFSIMKAKIDTLTLHKGMIFVQDTEDMWYTLNSGSPVAILQAGMMNSSHSEAITGSFESPLAAAWQIGQVLCIYQTVDPRQRDYVNNNYNDDAEAYIKITGLDGNTVTFSSIDESEAEKVVFIPDTLPFSVTELPSEITGQIAMSQMDKAARAFMGLNETAEAEVGDFIVLFVGELAEISDDTEVYYAVVTEIDADILTYKKTTKEVMEKALDTFLTETQDGDAMLENVDILALEQSIENQVRESGFAEDAAMYLASMATQTNGFKNLSNLTDARWEDANGNTLGEEEIALLGIGSNFKLSDKVKIKVELGKSSQYFRDGIRLALGIEAEFEIELNDDAVLKIVLKATFVEELAVDVQVKANAKVKWIFCFPKFKSLTFSTSVDLKNFAGVSVDVKVYTVEKEEGSIWEKLKGFNNGQYKEVFGQIEELKNKVIQAKDAIGKIQEYQEDMNTLWSQLNGVTTKEEYEGLLSTLGELNVTQDLLGLLQLTNETELDAGMRNLMERYSEMLENESDWVELVSKEIFAQEIHIKIFAIKLGVNFVVKANVNLALGANLEYVIGKRYTFWYDIISKTSGNSEMDLLDERFAFQFYVMGQLGLRMGIEAEIAVGIISTKIGSIGATAEFGPYLKLWGYFIYEYSKLRPANTNAWQYDEKMLGALYLEFGLYLEITFKAQALAGLFKYEPTLLDKEWPLLTAGERMNVYGFTTELEVDEVLYIIDADSNASNGITMVFPEGYRLMDYIDLVEGDLLKKVYDYDKFNIRFSDSHFSIDTQTGEIRVDAPEGVQYLECMMTLVWKKDKLTFRNVDMTLQIPLVWTNLSQSELAQRFTASVKVGNPQQGYQTVWSQRVVKNATFDLPTDVEIQDLLGLSRFDSGYGNLKYSAVTGYGGQVIDDLAILEDTVYYYDVTPRSYNITVHDVEENNGTKGTRVLQGTYGQQIDWNSLQDTGANVPSQGKFSYYLTTKVFDPQGNELIVDLTAPLDSRLANIILSGATFHAVYVDHSVTATIHFEGIELASVSQVLRKGSTPSLNSVMPILQAMNAKIVSMNPAITPISSPTSYTIVCVIETIPIVYRTVTFESRSGSEVASQSIAEGTRIQEPDAPIRFGYEFLTWTKDQINPIVFDFATELMPTEDMTLYALWQPVSVIVTLDVNEGLPWEAGQGTKSVAFDASYDDLTVPTRTGYRFLGWFTDRVGGETIAKETRMQKIANHTLYAHWEAKSAMSSGDIQIEPNQVVTFDTNAKTLQFSVELPSIVPESIVLRYKRQNLDSEWQTQAIHAGTYDVKFTRAEDEQYRSFEAMFTSALRIEKATRSLSHVPTASTMTANLLVEEIPKNSYTGHGVVEYALSTGTTIPTSGWQTSRAFMNLNAGTYYVFARLQESENYLITPAIISNQSYHIDGITANGLDYYHLISIQTSNIDKAGTDSKIYGSLDYIDGKQSQKTHFDLDGNDFEKGDFDTYAVTGLPTDPWMISKVHIYYEREGSAPGWHCDYVQPAAGKIVWEAGLPKLFQIPGERLSVNQWFGAEENDRTYVNWSGSTDSMKRVITAVGNMNTVPTNLQLERSGSAYLFVYDGLISDQYSGEGKTYNAYHHADAPTITIQSVNANYSEYVSYGINSISVNQAGLSEAMEADGVNATQMLITLRFPQRSTTTATATYEMLMTVSR